MLILVSLAEACLFDLPCIPLPLSLMTSTSNVKPPLDGGMRCKGEVELSIVLIPWQDKTFWSVASSSVPVSVTNKYLGTSSLIF